MATSPTPTPASPGMSKLDYAMLIAQLALASAATITTGSPQADIMFASSMVQIFNTAKAAIEQHVGQPIEESQIKPEAPVS